MDSATSPNRVILWAVPRSLSTAFVRCMERVPNTKIIFEPYSSADHFGPEGRLRAIDELPPEPEWTFQAVKDHLEEDHSDSDLVFVKDMAYAVDDKYEMIASGYQHTFIIRHPAKMFVSYYKSICDGNSNDEDVDEIFDKWLPSGLCYRELFDLYEHIIKSGSPEPIIIDADDLIEDPESIMSLYCRGVGVDFSDSILNWGVGTIDRWSISQVLWDVAPSYKWFDNSMKAGGFQKGVSKPLPSFSDLPNKIIDCIETSMPFYESLYGQRIQSPGTNK
ncbi:hypothetical protein SNE40_007282 [Patella caerulea]|uniref:Sulfotransferase family protein n=1 Tax=Patella caerulea TaxID=87958 RepID=A0AAN8PXA1_PATCE